MTASGLPANVVVGRGNRASFFDNGAEHEVVVVTVRAEDGHAARKSTTAIESAWLSWWNSQPPSPTA
jgi:hypothetical protein